jgi:hypothetical protein
MAVESQDAKEDCLMISSHPRLAREAKTIAAMIEIYCHANHRSPLGICPDCRDLLEYAQTRVTRCPYQENKTTCARCLVHCYKPEMRARIRDVMVYSGPRMMFTHPYLTLRHTLDGLFEHQKPLRPRTVEVENNSREK